MNNTNPRTNTWHAMELSLAVGHSSMDMDRNPVLRAFSENRLSPHQLAQSLAQYSLLPEAIVKLLTSGMGKLQRSECNFLASCKELGRNIGEELGSRTHGQIHYDILCDALAKETGLEVRGTGPDSSTAKFLNGLSEAVTNDNPFFVAGALYALEDSAVPELEIVATLINCQAERIVIDLTTAATSQSRKKTARGVVTYTLEDFFTLHIQDFERGHQSLLKAAITKDLTEYGSDNDWQALNSGFENVLNLMDRWWFELSTVMP